MPVGRFPKPAKTLSGSTGLSAATVGKPEFLPWAVGFCCCVSLSVFCGRSHGLSLTILPTGVTAHEIVESVRDYPGITVPCSTSFREVSDPLQIQQHKFQHLLKSHWLSQPSQPLSLPVVSFHPCTSPSASIDGL